MPNLAHDLITEVHSTYDSVLASFAEHAEFDFWKSAQDLGDKTVKYADAKLKEEASRYSVPLEKIEEFKQGIKDLIDSVSALRINPPSELVKWDFNITEFNQKLSYEIDLVVADLMAEFKEPPPENQTERYQRREDMVSKALNGIENALVIVYGLWGISESEGREKFSNVKHNIRYFVLIVGNMVDNHPILIDIILTSTVLMILPEDFILLPLLRVFGFGLLGPVRGSAATWAQRTFFGAVVKRGSWFSRLQSAAMKWVPSGLSKKVGIGAGSYWSRM